MTQSNDLPSRMNRAEDTIIDLRLATSSLIEAVNKNSGDIAIMAEAIRRNSQEIRHNSEAIRRNSEAIRHNSEDVLRNSEETRRNSEDVLRNSEDVRIVQRSFEIVLAEMREDRRRSDERFTQLLQAIQLRPE